MRKIFPLFCFVLTACSSLNVPQTTPKEITYYKPKSPVHIALVLGGGGSKGLAHLGAIRELEAAGVRPNLIVACSAGSIVGALYAEKPELTGIDTTLLSLKSSDLLDTSYINSRFGLVEGKALEQFMERTLNAKTFEELKIPLIVIATDLFDGDCIELSEDEIPIAVRASCAFPGLFKPVLLHDRYLIDGGVSCPMPIKIAKRYNADFIIAIDVSEKLPTPKPTHFFGVAMRAMEITYRKFIEHSLDAADIAIKMDFQDVGMFGDHLNHELYEHGRQQVIKMLPEIKRKLMIAKRANPNFTAPIVQKLESEKQE